MLIDHTAIAVLNPYIDYNVGNMSYEQFKAMSALYSNMRLVGRVAFPIYCFLIVEGFCHTKDFRKYVRNMAVFAVISEPFFDMALFGKIPYNKNQNVFFTLLIGLCCIHLLQLLSEGKAAHIHEFFIERKGGAENIAIKRLHPAFVFIASLVAIAGSMAIAYYLRTDYDYKGVLVIVLMYLFRRSRLLQTVLGELPLQYEPAAFFSIIPLLFYNHKRGKLLNGKYFKYFFYAFYPAHLGILYLISYALGCR